MQSSSAFNNDNSSRTHFQQEELRTRIVNLWLFSVQLNGWCWVHMIQLQFLLKKF